MEEYIVEIDSEYITLSQLLKGVGIISTGGQAKAYLAEHDIFIDGEQDQRRGRKVYPGSQVKIPSSDSVFKVENSSIDKDDNSHHSTIQKD